MSVYRSGGMNGEVFLPRFRDVARATALVGLIGLASCSSGSDTIAVENPQVEGDITTQATEDDGIMDVVSVQSLISGIPGCEIYSSEPTELEVKDIVGSFEGLNDDVNNSLNAGLEGLESSTVVLTQDYRCDGEQRESGYQDIAWLENGNVVYVSLQTNCLPENQSKFDSLVDYTRELNPQPTVYTWSCYDDQYETIELVK